MRKNTNHQNIPLDVFENSGLMRPSGRSEAVSAAHCAANTFTYSFISRLMQTLSSAVRTALGFMRGRYFLKSCTRQSINQPEKLTPQQLTQRLTELRETLLPDAVYTRLGSVIYPAESDDPATNPLPAILANKMQVPGTNGRWCPVCNDYWQFAVLKRYGNSASMVDYVPLCPKHGCLLWPDKEIHFVDD